VGGKGGGVLWGCVGLWIVHCGGGLSLSYNRRPVVLRSSAPLAAGRLPTNTGERRGGEKWTNAGISGIMGRAIWHVGASRGSFSFVSFHVTEGARLFNQSPRVTRLERCISFCLALRSAQFSMMINSCHLAHCSQSAADGHFAQLVAGGVKRGVYQQRERRHLR
jgi:hypothetical protein